MANGEDSYLFWTSCIILTLIEPAFLQYVITVDPVPVIYPVNSLPPFIIKQTWAAEILFEVAKTGEDESNQSFQLECEADAYWPLTYRWIKDGQEFIWQDHKDRVSQKPGQGTLIFASPRDEDAGEYQCYAMSKQGTAVSKSVQVRKVGEYLPAAVKQKIRSVEAMEGKPFKLNCGQAEGRRPPNQKVFWNLVHTVGGFSSLNSSRVTADPSGDLRFSNVTREDASINFFYVCSSCYPSSEFMREIYALKVVPTNTSIHNEQNEMPKRERTQST